MKRLIIAFVIFLNVVVLGCSSCPKKERPKELINIAALKVSPAFTKVSPIRLKMLQETATTIGAQAGLSWRSAQINCDLKREQDNLDRIYNFRRLLLKDDVLPPVLEEGRQELTRDDCNTIRASDRIYRIVTSPCFVTAPPTWRDYIWMRYSKPEQPDVALLPRNSDEAAIWNCCVTVGWKQGIDQANQIFSANLGRLQRDYDGMILYRTLLAQNMVTPPYVSKTELGVTGDANQIRVNDRILRISATSELNTNPDSWRPAVTPSSEYPQPYQRLLITPHKTCKIVKKTHNPKQRTSSH
jgi:defect in organelle trafficking protein DotC